MTLKGSYCHEGTKGDKKAIYEVKFDSEQDALSHIESGFTVAEIVAYFWYGYHILGVNKIAKIMKTANEGYDKAEAILNKDFPELVTFERDVEKARTMTAEEKEIARLTKGMSVAQVKEMLSKQ